MLAVRAIHKQLKNITMIRFLKLKNQICEGQNHFAFFDTITDTILYFDKEQVFSSLKDFENAYNKSFMNEENSARPLSRFTGLIPKDYFDVSLPDR